VIDVLIFIDSENLFKNDMIWG